MADPLTILGQPVSPDAFAETLSMWVHCRAEDVVVGHLRSVLESLPEAVRERVVAR